MPKFVESLTEACREAGKSQGLDEAARIIDEIRRGTTGDEFEILSVAWDKLQAASSDHWQKQREMFAALHEPVRVTEEAVLV